ncbi:MAG: DMT family transporter [Patescibacteria group bacterium]
MFFFLAIIGYLLLAVVSLLDKLILTKSINKPVVYAFYANVFMFGALLAWPLSGEFLRGVDWWWAILSGAGFGLGMWTIYISQKESEATHVVPFNGAMISISVYGLSAFFLGEKLVGAQVAGIMILLFASFLLSLENSSKHRGFHRGFFWAALSGLFFAISHVSAKYLYEIYPFWTGFVWSKAAVGLVAVPMLFSLSVRNSLFKRKNKLRPKTVGKRYSSLIFIINKVLSISSVVLIQYAAAIGSVTIVNAVAGAQYAFMFVLAYFSTKFWPKVFKEYFTKKEISIQLIAIAMVVVGMIFFVL